MRRITAPRIRKPSGPGASPPGSPRARTRPESAGKGRGSAPAPVPRPHSGRTSPVQHGAHPCGRCHPSHPLNPLPACGGRGCVPSPGFPTSPPQRARRRGREPLQLHSAAKSKSEIKIKIKGKSQGQNRRGAPGTPPAPGKTRPGSRFPPAPPSCLPTRAAREPRRLTARGSRTARGIAGADRTTVRCRPRRAQHARPPPPKRTEARTAQR